MDQSNYTNMRAYSGPLSLRRDALPSVDIDLFGLSDFQLRAPADRTKFLSLQQNGDFLSFDDLEVNSELPGYQQLVANAPAGLYRVIYVDGAINLFNNESDKFNFALDTQFGNQDYKDLPSYRIWIRVAENNEQMYYFGEPAFRNPGYLNATDAKNAAIGTGFVFYHPGGKIEAIIDDEFHFFGDNDGIVKLYIDNAVCQGPGQPTPGPRAGFWDVIWSSLPDKANWPGMWNPYDALPRIGNIQQGVHILRYQLNVVDEGCPWYQDIYIRAWRMPPRGSPMAFIDPNNQDIPNDFRYAMENIHLPDQVSLFPVKPAKPIQPGKFQNPMTRRPVHQQPKYSGNQPERPESPNVNEHPKSLGPNEKF